MALHNYTVLIHESLPLAGENHKTTFWPFNTKGVPLRTQRSLREKLQFLYY
jgi:hypothetical protein